MTENVYVNLSVVDLKPAVLNFLSELADTAKESVFVTRMKDLAAELGRDIRTVQRYMKELTSKEIIELKGRKGRGGATVIRFNAELIQFTTSDRALINSEEPVDIDELLQTKIPKKKPEHNPNKRARRTKTQMAEAKLLQDEKQAEIDRLNGQLQTLGGVPNWDWFQQTDNPVGNYKTYLVSRAYNRYAKLYTEYENALADHFGNEKKLPLVSNNYDVLGHSILGSSRWDAFQKLSTFCDENSISPFVYLSAQFSRSFFAAVNGKSKPLPFVNALLGDSSYKVYQEYVGYHKKVYKGALMFSDAPKGFASDFVIQALADAYENAHKSSGLLQYKHSVKEFLTDSAGFGDQQEALAKYYRDVDKQLKEAKVDIKHRNVLKKFILTQAMTQIRGIRLLPKHVILGSEYTQFVLASADKLHNGSLDMKCYILSGLINGEEAKVNDEAKEEGWKYHYQLTTLDETSLVLRLIQERKGLHISVNEVREALAAVGGELVPVNDYSMLDVDQIAQKVLPTLPSYQDDIDFSRITSKGEWATQGTVVENNPVDAVLKGLQL